MPWSILKGFINIYKCLAEPGVKIRQLNPVTDFDIERLNHINAKREYVPGKEDALHVLISKWYSQRPNEIALLSTTTSVTYSELGQKSATMALLLTERGIKPGDYVGLCLEKSPFAIIALLGILRAGASYIPINSCNPPDRISKIVHSAGIRHIISDDSSREKLRNINTALIELDQNKVQDTKTLTHWDLDAPIDPSMPVYVMFTSGSTGLPKGVIHIHGSVSASLLECIDEFQIDSSTKFMLGASLAFDASILEIFAPLAAGGCLCIPSQEERDSDLELFMRKVRVTFAFLTPSLLPHIQPKNLPDLRDLFLGGEPPSNDLIATLGNRVRLHNLYGTTEAGVWDTHKSMMRTGDDPKNIGRGIGGVSCWITDPADVQMLRPFGAEGELLIQSPHLAREYLHDPERNAAAFLDPGSLEWASCIPGAGRSRFYRTGDLARFNEKGEVIFVGRQTGFVKIRGLRVDLGEVESAIDSTLQSGRSAVVLSEGNGSDMEIVAFIETTDLIGNHLTDEMHNRLSKVLADYMIPSVCIRVDKLPLTMSKKIDRQRLREDLSTIGQNKLCSYRRGGDSDNDFEAIPSTQPIAIEISRMVAKMLTKQDLKDGDSLLGMNFSLQSVGMNSIQLVSLAKWLKNTYGKKIRIEDLRASHTVYDVEGLVINKSLCRTKEVETENLIERFAELKPDLPLRKKTVFCTSITGFLGSQILRSLLDSPGVEHVIGLVRADNETKAMQKVQQQAELGQWWDPSFQDRIEIFLGDLSKPRLGLDENQWNRLFGKSDHPLVDGIIHNGAKVNWINCYAELESVNVNSTLDILSGMLQVPSPCPLIFVSGGYLSNREENPMEIAKRLSAACGYDQTKFMSELLVTQYNKNLDYQNIHAIKAQTFIPGFIVGTREEGIAHPEDFLWRLAFSLARLGAVSKDLGWLAVAGVDQVSNLISEVLLHPSEYDAKIIACTDGVDTSVLCHILAKKLNRPIRSIDHDKWMKMLRDDVESADFDHPFLPVLDWFEENSSQLMESSETSQNRYFEDNEIVEALESSVDYLLGMDYFRDGISETKNDLSGMFSRSRD